MNIPAIFDDQAVDSSFGYTIGDIFSGEVLFLNVFLLLAFVFVVFTKVGTFSFDIFDYLFFFIFCR